MAKIWSVYFPKGGVGKTTLAFNMVRYYAMKGLKVLAIGLDDQASLSLMLNKMPISENIDDLFLAASFALEGKKSFLLESIQPTDLETLGFIPETKEIRELYTLIKDKYGLSFLKKSFLPLLTNEFDLILFDCPPAQSNALVQAALVASDLVVLPFSCQRLAVSSWHNNFDELEDFLMKNNPSCAVKVIANNLDNTGPAKEAFRYLQDHYNPLVVGEPLLRRVEFEAAGSCSISVIEQSNSVNAQRLINIFNTLWSQHGHQKIENIQHRRVRTAPQNS
jgi:chromosome partitioning protein